MLPFNNYNWTSPNTRMGADYSPDPRDMHRRICIACGYRTSNSIADDLCNECRNNKNTAFGQVWCDRCGVSRCFPPDDKCRACIDIVARDKETQKRKDRVGEVTRCASCNGVGTFGGSVHCISCAEKEIRQQEKLEKMRIETEREEQRMRDIMFNRILELCKKQPPPFEVITGEDLPEAPPLDAFWTGGDDWICIMENDRLTLITTEY